MTMRIVFLEKYEDYKPGDDAFIPRPKARILCEEEKAVPYMTWADAEKKHKEDSAKVKKQESKKEPAKKPAPPKRRYKQREKAVTVDDSATSE